MPDTLRISDTLVLQAIVPDSSSYLLHDSLAVSHIFSFSAQRSDFEVVSSSGSLLSIGRESFAFAGNYYKSLASPEWLFVALLLLFVAAGWVRNKFSRIINDLINSVFNFKEAMRFVENRNALTERFFFVLRFLQSFSFGFVAYLAFSSSGLDLMPLPAGLDFLVLSAALSILFFVRSLTLRLAAFVSGIQAAVHYYIQFNMIFFSALLIIILPFSALLPFVSKGVFNILLYSSLIAYLLGYAFLFFSGIKIFLSQRIGILHYILYFCTLEIIPLLVVIKLITRYLVSIS